MFWRKGEREQLNRLIESLTIWAAWRAETSVGRVRHLEGGERAFQERARLRVRIERRGIERFDWQLGTQHV
jgi:hypothetical protein